ncbi:MAG: hypothetical protein J6A53_06690 [Clostridia bacterium]|nr:hypothetical protein [Clostridia bacterium]
MKKQTLNGTWKYRIGKGAEKEISVPFSALCVGHSECRKSFGLNYDSNVVLLKFDGIAYNANAYLNGIYLGKMLPYSEYVFDITEYAKKENNELLVELEDIDAPFGPSEGWENYGGIIRDVSLIYKNENYIINSTFCACMTNNYNDAKYTVTVNTKNEIGKLSVSLSYGKEIIDTYECKIGERVERQINNVHLWSPDFPNLYNLTVNIIYENEIIDTYSEDVGFREFKCDTQKFYLNGKPIFLNGVCKHEMCGDSGHTVKKEQIENDLMLIKEMGCNFVRLVHYPHNKAVLELCDKIGLMCCEEPGLWQSDTSNPQVVNDCLEVLKRTVIRDRNHPSIIFWLCFNECDFDENFLKSSVRVCREHDATRLVSGANNMSNEDTLKYYNLCDLDFYTMHPYYETFEKARESAEILKGKPLMFTEWGGYYVYDNPHLVKDFLREMHLLYKNGNLAGQSFWYFAEIYDCNRGGDACVDGVLKEALFDLERRPNLIYYAFCQAIKDMNKTKNSADLYEFSQLVEYEPKSPFECQENPDYSKLLEICQNPPYTRLAKTRKKQISVGPILQKEELAHISKIPYVIDKEYTFTLDGITDEISIVGLTSISQGYPVLGKRGEEGAELEIIYKDGSTQEYSLKNGIDFCLAYTSVGSSRINPICEKSTTLARFSYDKNFEEYIINKLDIPVLKKEIARIIIKPISESYKILIYGIYAN